MHYKPRLPSMKFASSLSVNCHDNWLSWQFTDKLDGNFIDGRPWNWLSWQSTDKLDANLWSLDGETDCRDSLLTNSMQTSLTVDGAYSAYFTFWEVRLGIHCRLV